jgi:hypothetical protein
VQRVDDWAKPLTACVAAKHTKTLHHAHHRYFFGKLAKGSAL